MDLRQYALIVWRWAWLVVLGGLVVAGAALAIGLSTQPVYRASTTLLVSEAPDSRSSNYNDILTSERLARTYSELLTRRPILDEVIQRLALPMSAASLADRLDVQLVRETRLIVVSAEDPDPQLAAAIANLVPEVFDEQNQALQSQRFESARESLEQEMAAVQAQLAETQAAIDAIEPEGEAAPGSELAALQAELAQTRETYSSLRQSYDSIRVAEAQSLDSVLIYEPAQPPANPARPQIALTTVLAAVVGITLALGAVFLIEHLDDSIKSPDRAAALLALPVLGALGRLPGGRAGGQGAGPVAMLEPRSPASEAFRALRTSIQFSGVDRPLHKLLVTSAGPGEGKSTLTANLAVVMAQAGLSVIVVDCDLRRPTLHTIFGCANNNGLTHLMLQSEAQPEDLLRATDTPQLRVLTSGARPPNPAELLGSARMSQVMDQLASFADIVLFDSPPLLPVTDAAVLAGRVDGVLLAVDARRTRVGMARQALAILKRVGANTIGLIINRLPARSGDGYYYAYHSPYEHDDDQRPPAKRRLGLSRKSSNSGRSVKAVDARAME